MNLSQLPQLPDPYSYNLYLITLLGSFFIAFALTLKYTRSFKHSMTAGLLASKIVILYGYLVGLDKVFLVLRIGPLRVPISVNLLFMLGGLLTTLWLNSDKIIKHLTITDEELQPPESPE
ncbi:MAG: hypothetical protein QXT64_05340 [Desulfurococcaceae archaeon]